MSLLGAWCVGTLIAGAVLGVIAKWLWPGPYLPDDPWALPNVVANIIRPIGNVIYLAPALTIEQDDVAFLTRVIAEVLRERHDLFTSA